MSTFNISDRENFSLTQHNPALYDENQPQSFFQSYKAFHFNGTLRQTQHPKIPDHLYLT